MKGERTEKSEEIHKRNERGKQSIKKEKEINKFEE